MCRHVLLFFILCIGLKVNAQTVNLHGKVCNQDGEPVADAIVTLVGQDLIDTTGSDGTYEIVRTEVAVLQELQPEHKNFIVDKGSLVFSLPETTPLKIELFDVKGTLLKRESMTNVPSGFYRFGIAENPLSAKVLIIRVVIGEDAKTFRYLPLQNGNCVIDQLPADGSSIKNTGLMKIAAIDDTLEITAEGYKEKSVAIVSYEQELDITLDKEDGAFGTGSIGCGKDLSDLKSGTYKITSAGLSREYIIDIPENYDKNNPYRLIFGMHCFGSNMQGVANENYYQLKRFADSTKTYCIFVAPNGVISNGNAMWNQEEKDHTFFDDMLKLFKEELCIDTTRVFSCGFSYGAMFTNSLSLNHQNVLRAVACYAPANWNIYLPQNTHEPVAYMSTTGLSDPNCPFVYNDANKEGGKYCVLTHAEDNGCTIPNSIPMVSSGSRSHLCYEFEGCQDEYPVKVCTFDGGHQAGHIDGASGDDGRRSWIPGETWEFFMRF